MFLFLLVEEQLRVTAFAFHVKGLPMTILVAFCARDSQMVLVEGESGNAVVLKAQVGAFPAVHGVTLEAILAQCRFVWFILQVAVFAYVIVTVRLFQVAYLCAVVALAALCTQVFSAHVFAADPAVEYMFKSIFLFGPTGERVTGSARGTVFSWMLDLMASFT